MMDSSKISSKNFTKNNIKTISKPKDYGMNTDSSMIWLLKSLNQTEDSSGLAKITTEMFNPILLPKDSVH